MILVFFVQLYSLLFAIFYNAIASVHLKSSHLSHDIKFSNTNDIIIWSDEEGLVTLSLKPGTFHQKNPNTSTGHSELEAGIILL